MKRTDVSLLIVGDGTGKDILQSRLPEGLQRRVVFTGRLPEAHVVNALNAMDIGFITQTLDQLGNFRLTTKLPEYLATGLPIASERFDASVLRRRFQLFVNSLLTPN